MNPVSSPPSGGGGRAASPRVPPSARGSGRRREEAASPGKARQEERAGGGAAVTPAARHDRAPVTCPVFISVAAGVAGRWRGGLTMSLPAKRCGRPPVLSFLEKKKRKQSLDRRRGKTRIYVGNHIDRWLTLKEKLDFRNDAEVAGFLLDLYDSYDPLSKAPVCSLPEGVRRITVKEERTLSGSTSLIAADGTYDNDDQLSKDSICSDLGDVRIVTVKKEREMPCDCLSTETDDTAVLSEATAPSVDC